MSLMRNLRTQWSSNDLAEALITLFQRCPPIVDLFVGATPMDQVAHKIATIVQAQAPELVRESPVEPAHALPILATAVQAVVLKSLQGEQLLQAEYLILPLTRTLVDSLDTANLPAAQQRLAEGILRLYRQWEEASRQQRSTQRNMMQHQ
ncbi:hypothetical protein [Ferrimonas gelatinilytica]|uniref:Uncharacterized protein n=1 Tax=Ferrimonas gelatinilytica TaxID=1255257 RepID=A0ABP9RTC8_9GAMM